MNFKNKATIITDVSKGAGLAALKNLTKKILIYHL